MPTARNHNIKPATWLYISGAAFVIFILLAFFLGLFSAVFNKLQPATYFFLLIPLALMAAAFLFGAMRSHAKYAGKAYGGTLELGGPVVLLVIIIYLGYKFRPVANAMPFSLTVNVLGSDSATIVTSGALHLFYGTAKHTIKITDGQAVLQEMPPDYRGRAMRIIPEVDGYMTAPITDTVPQESNSLQIYLKETVQTVTVSGIVKSSKGVPVANAVLVFADGSIKDSTDAYGNFKTALPYKDGTEMPLRIYKGGVLSYDNLVTLSNATSMNIQLQ